jgi:hypothetical protein
MVSSEAEDSLDSTPSARAFRSTQTGQNSIAPENSLPQLGQMRWGCVLMALTVIRHLSRTQRDAAPIGAKSADGIRWRMMVRLHCERSA